MDPDVLLKGATRRSDQRGATEKCGPEGKGQQRDGGPVALGLPPGLKEGWIDTIPHRFHTKVWNSI